MPYRDRKSAEHRAREAAYRAERRRNGLCVQCPRKSAKYRRCTRCRLREQRLRRIESIPLDESAQSV